MNIDSLINKSEPVECPPEVLSYLKELESEVRSIKAELRELKAWKATAGKNVGGDR